MIKSVALMRASRRDRLGGTKGTQRWADNDRLCYPRFQTVEGLGGGCCRDSSSVFGNGVSWLTPVRGRAPYVASMRNVSRYVALLWSTKSMDCRRKLVFSKESIAYKVREHFCSALFSASALRDLDPKAVAAWNHGLSLLNQRSFSPHFSRVSPICIISYDPPATTT